jgi:two-component system cell cycle response regulator CtrA
MLPDMDGLEVLRRLRANQVNAPVLILSGLSDVGHKAKGLNIGADDYLTKPFDNRELLARIEAVLRRFRGHDDSVVRTGDLTVNFDTQSVEIRGTRVYVTPKEYRILELLCQRQGVVLSKEIFLDHLYAGRDEPETKIIDVFVCKLRKKLAQASGGNNYIETVWGRGYMLRAPMDGVESSTIGPQRAAV